MSDKKLKTDIFSGSSSVEAELIVLKFSVFWVDFMAGMTADREHIKINQESRADILSISKTHIINRVLPRGGVSG